MKIFNSIKKIGEFKIFKFKRKNNYILSKSDLNKIIKYGSNHPRRKDYLDSGTIFQEKKQVPEIINPWLIKTDDKFLNIIIGDSHAEFSSRIYKSALRNKKRKPILSLTMHTGSTTLIGSLLSSSYFIDVVINIKNLLNKKEIKIKNYEEINIIFSLGEIDVRTKVSLESFKNNEDYKYIIDKYINNIFEDKLTEFKQILDQDISYIKHNLFFLIPPPPANSSYLSPMKNLELKIIEDFLKVFPYPNIYDLDHRLKIYHYLTEKLEKICNKINIQILENKEYRKDLSIILTDKYSHDLCHVSLGDWALSNCLNIIWLTKK